jgi:hypothetical protein
MRHFTWAIAWFVVGLAVTLGTASVLQQVVSGRQAAAQPVIAPAAPAHVVPAPAAKPPAGGHDMVVASRHFYREH